MSETERATRLATIAAEREKRIAALNKFFKSLLRKSVEDLRIATNGEPADIWLEREQRSQRAALSAGTSLPSGSTGASATSGGGAGGKISSQTKHRMSDEYYDQEAVVLGFGFRGERVPTDAVKVMLSNDETTPTATSGSSEAKSPTSSTNGGMSGDKKSAEWFRLVVCSRLLLLLRCIILTFLTICLTHS
jgi:hypothetical protein